MIFTDEPPESRLSVRVTSPSSEGAADVVCAGEIDVSTASLLRERLESVITDGAVHLVVDLKAVTLIDSSGLGILVRARRQVDHLSVRGLTDLTRYAFMSTGLNHTIDILDG